MRKQKDKGREGEKKIKNQEVRGGGKGRERSLIK